MWRSTICRRRSRTLAKSPSSSAMPVAKAVPLPGDLRSEQFCNKLVQDAARELGGLDILVSNAARQYSADDIAKLTTEQFDDTFKTNVYAMFWLTKAALPHLQPGAAIIN